jgi:hypothetical protein
VRIEWTQFALERHSKPGKHTWFSGSTGQLVQVIHGNWSQRKPGFGRTSLDEVVVVPVPPALCHGTTATLRDGMQLTAEVTRRRPDEDPFVSIRASVAPDPAAYAQAVLYSRALLLPEEPGFAGDWGIVSLQASSIEDEPMHPLTMARNMLEKAGGTKATYTAQQFAEAIYYWSQKVTATGSDTVSQPGSNI